MRYNKIRKMDIADGPGVRVSIFMQGCAFNCPKCFNQETHDFAGGKEFTQNTINKVLELCAKGESLSNHPIAASIIKEYGKEVSTEDIKEHREYQGKGITYNYKDQNIKIGNSKFCNQKETKNIYLMINDNLVAELEIKDKKKVLKKQSRYLKI